MEVPTTLRQAAEIMQSGLSTNLSEFIHCRGNAVRFFVERKTTTEPMNYGLMADLETSESEDTNNDLEESVASDRSFIAKLFNGICRSSLVPGHDVVSETTTGWWCGQPSRMILNFLHLKVIFVGRLNFGWRRLCFRGQPLTFARRSEFVSYSNSTGSFFGSANVRSFVGKYRVD